MLSADELAEATRIIRSHGYDGPIRCARSTDPTECSFLFSSKELATLPESALVRELQRALRQKVRIGMLQPVWFRRDFPWLGGGFIHAVDEGYADDFSAQLAEGGFELRTLDGSSGRSVFVELGSALNFPDYYGGSGWDSVIDCFRDVDLPSRCAIMWRHADQYASLDPKLFGEACAVLTDVFDKLAPEGCQVVLVLTGHGPAFKRPPA